MRRLQTADEDAVRLLRDLARVVLLTEREVLPLVEQTRVHDVMQGLEHAHRERRLLRNHAHDGGVALAAHKVFVVLRGVVTVELDADARLARGVHDRAPVVAGVDLEIVEEVRAHVGLRRAVLELLLHLVDVEVGRRVDVLVVNPLAQDEVGVVELLRLLHLLANELLGVVLIHVADLRALAHAVDVHRAVQQDRALQHHGGDLEHVRRERVVRGDDVDEL
mmetsp:Transcript_22124/g.68689  ORF Transcript_22124/g.68689 Transcript_22124/m.68689 type:complete len:221 (+) Transcript_22124:2219-2881(+)